MRKHCYLKKNDSMRATSVLPVKQTKHTTKMRSVDFKELLVLLVKELLVLLDTLSVYRKLQAFQKIDKMLILYATHVPV